MGGVRRGNSSYWASLCAFCAFTNCTYVELNEYERNGAASTMWQGRECWPG